MKVLIHGINYAPEAMGIGRYSGDMAEWLAAHGIEVRVVCAPPYYPDWRVQDGHRWPPYRIEQRAGVQVHRVPLWVPARPGGLARVLHLLSFAITSVPSMLQQWRWRPDIVLAVAPALASAPVALAFARARGARAWLHIQDFEVDVAFSMGLLPSGGWLQRLMLAGERRLLRSFDRVTTISGTMLALLDAKGLARDRIGLFPNWADLTHLRPLDTPSPYRQELGIAADQHVLLFSGTLSNKQGLHVIPRTAARLAERSDIRFVICGDGPMRAEIDAACRVMPNVSLLPMQPYERLNDLLGLADIHLLPQSPEAADLVLPSKLSGMLASGRPVIATCHSGTELASVVERCGLVVPPEDDAALARAICELVDDPGRRARMGAAGRTFAERSIDREAVLCGLLEGMRQQCHRPSTE